MPKPTAVVLSVGGKVATPVARSRVAPVPMKRLPWVIDTASRSPFKVAVAPSSGSSTPLTEPRETVNLAEPYTTSARLNPTLPPIWRPGAVATMARPAEANGLPADAASV